MPREEKEGEEELSVHSSGQQFRSDLAMWPDHLTFQSKIYVFRRALYL